MKYWILTMLALTIPCWGAPLPPVIDKGELPGTKNQITEGIGISEVESNVVSVFEGVSDQTACKILLKDLKRTETAFDSLKKSLEQYEGSDKADRQILFRQAQCDQVNARIAATVMLERLRSWLKQNPGEQSIGDKGNP